MLVKKARANLDTVMPGYTHLQRAQPTTFAHYMMAYANMFKRDVTRLEDCLERLDECPLGAGALATSTYEVDRFNRVLPHEMELLTIEEGKDSCTLVTCTPYGVNTHRLLVRGVRTD